MARTLTAALQTESEAAALTPIFFLELDFSGGFSRYWTGFGDLTWNSNTWTGGGHLIGITPILETEQMQATGAQFSLSGIPAATISIALAQTYQGRPAKLWLGALDSASAVVADPVLIFDGRMDVMTIREGGDVADISISAESRLIDLERPRDRRWTHEDQLIDYPPDAGSPTETDRGFEFVPSLQDATFDWRG